MFSYKFIVDGARGDSLRLRLISRRRKAEVSLGVCMTAEVLENVLSERPRPENVKWKSLLTGYMARLDDIRCELLKRGGGDVDVKVLRDMVLRDCLGRGVDEEPVDAGRGGFARHFEEFARGKERRGTRVLYLHTLDRMRAFDGGLDERSFEDIDVRWLTGFEAFCARTAGKNARNVHLRNIRAVFNSAIDFGLTVAYPFRRFKIRPEATRKRSLGVEELRELFCFPAEDYAVFYRDMFKLIFMLIGINTVDLHGLREVTRDGRVEYRRAKTGRLYSIRVEPEAMELIERYRGERGLLCVADRWSDSRNFTHQLNMALQRMGSVERRGRGGRKVIEAAFPGVTSYWARHSWATIAYSLDIPKDVIAQALGHADGHDTTNIYIDEDRRKVDVANRRVLDWVLYGKR